MTNKRKTENASPRRRSAAGSSEALTKLREFIQSGDFQPGASLPAERQLAAKLGVGRPALREAIKALSVLDAIESRPGAGTYVKSISLTDGSWPQRVQLRPATYTMLELLEVRKIFEPRTAWLAAARAREADLRQIAEAHRALKEHDDDWKLIVKYDLELHSAIIRAARNPILVQINQILAPVMLRSREITARSMRDLAMMHANHGQILDAIFRGHPDEAEQAMIEHLHTVGLDLITEIKL